MKHIKKFENHEAKINEENIGLIGVAPALFLIYGIMYGYVKIKNIIDYVSFIRAASKLEPIFDKIKDDAEMSEMILKLGEYEDGLYFGEVEGGNPRREKAFDIIREIYRRAKELLDDREYNIFIGAAKEFERGSGKPGAYFTNKDSRFQGWERGV
jgi:hypothetical protein